MVKQKPTFISTLTEARGTDLSEVVRIVIEDTEDADGTAISRKITGMNYKGATLREALIEDPTVSPLKAHCTSVLLNSDNRITEQRAVSAHTVIDTDAELKKFLNPTSGTNDADTVNSSTGHRAGVRIRYQRLSRWCSSQTGS